jgi:hypothetical protein
MKKIMVYGVVYRNGTWEEKAYSFDKEGFWWVEDIMNYFENKILKNKNVVHTWLISHRDITEEKND